MAEDEFDPIPVLITKNPQGKKERMGKESDISSPQKSTTVPNLQRVGGKQHLMKEIGVMTIAVGWTSREIEIQIQIEILIEVI